MTESTLPIPAYRTPAARADKLIPAATALLVALCVAAVCRLALGAWPFAISETRWRFETADLLLATAPQLALLLTVIAVAGVYSGRYQTVRRASLALLGLAGLLTLAVPVFAHDFLAIRRIQGVATIEAFTSDGTRLGVTAALAVPFMIWAGIRGWAAGRPDPESEPGNGLIVGQPT
jgi:hypothetical protein